MWWLFVKKLINVLTYFILLGIIGFVIWYFYDIYKCKTLTGKITYYDNNVMEISTDNEAFYSFNYGNQECKLNDEIKIFYTGKLEDTSPIQNITIKKISKIKSQETNITKKLEMMSLEEKVGQLLLARVPLTHKIDDLKTYHLGGYILFQRDIENKTKEEVQMEIKNYQKESNLPLFIAIDEEGGTVSRLNWNDNITKEKFLSPKELYQKGGFDLIEKDAIRKRELLQELGININLAPVADMSNDENSFIFARTFGSNAEETAQYIKTILKTQNDKVFYVLKHFPGYGDNLDTHTGNALDNRSLKTFEENDFKPFISGIDNGAKFIMLSHNIVSNVDNVPTSLSKIWHNILRNQLHFEGIILTDDLSMKASQINTSTPYIDAVKAGNNLLIVSDYKAAFKEIYDAVQNKIITETFIDTLISKNLTLKDKII